MLPEVVHVSHSHDAFGSDGFVVRFDALRNSRGAEFRGCLRTHSSQSGKAFIRRRWNLRIRTLDVGEQIIDLLSDYIRELRICDQVGGQLAGHLLAQSRYSIK